MPIKDCKTEEIIINTAIEMFFKEGRINATTQEIAEKAGVNRTLIHYYFRSKNQLLSIAFQKAQEEYRYQTEKSLDPDLPLKEKTEKFIDIFLRKMNDYPYLEAFLSIEIIQHNMGKPSLIPLPPKSSPFLKTYLHEIDQEMKKGNIPKMNPVHFMINMYSLIIHPNIMKPLLKHGFSENDDEFENLIQERKQVIMQTLFPYNN